MQLHHTPLRTPPPSLLPPRHRLLRVVSAVFRRTSSTITSHTGQPEKHAVDRNLRPPMHRHLAVVDDNGEGATGDDDNGNGAMGDGSTGYNDGDDGDWRRRQLRWRRRGGRWRDRRRRR
jgi:hypothetical protein